MTCSILEVALISHDRHVPYKLIVPVSNFLVEYKLARQGLSEYFFATAIGNGVWVLEPKRHYLASQLHRNHLFPSFRGDVLLVKETDMVLSDAYAGHTSGTF